MALPTIATVQADITSIYSALAERKTLPRGRQGVQALNEVYQSLNEAYEAQYTITATDGANMGADDAAFIATGGLFAAKGDVAGVAGDIFICSDNADTTDNALQTAKGSAPAAGDLFQVDAGAATVTYLGAWNSGVPFDMDDEQLVDFAVKAGS